MQSHAKFKRSLFAVTGWEVRAGARPPVGVDARLLPLIRSIADTGTLTAAARACAIPYRSAWAVLEEAGEVFAAPLVELARGRGATLTPLAQRWIALDDEARSALDGRSLAIEPRSTDSRTPSSVAASLRVAASHDIALAQLKDRWRVAHGIAVEFRGSGASLEAFKSGRAELAGIHVETGASSSDPLLARLDPSRDALLRFHIREQGLILARGNPKRVRTLADLAAKRLVLVNRQPASGTRYLFDRLLGRAGVDPAALAGYSNEEFTHAAVAATVASGRADVGFGIRASAAQFGLAFVPLATERYLFVCRRRAQDSARLQVFRALLASAATRAVVTPLPGYRLDRPGTVATFASGDAS